MNKIIAIFFSLIFLVMVSSLVFLSIPSMEKLDFRAFYTGGMMINMGIKGDFYNLQTQYKLQHLIFPGLPENRILAFYNPPFVALLYSLLALFPVTVAYIIVGIVNMIILLICFILLYMNVDKKKNTSFFIFLLLFPPIYMCFAQGQSSFLLLLAVTASWYCLKRNKLFLAGISLALLAVKPHLLILPLALLIWKKQWQVLKGSLLVIGIFAIISLQAVGLQAIKQYFAFLLISTSFGERNGIHPGIEPTLRGLLHMIFQTNLFSVIWIPFFFGLYVLFILFFKAWQGKWDTKSKMFDQQWAILVLMIVLTSIHTNYHDLVLLIFPFIIFLNSIENIYRRTIFGIVTNLVFVFFFIPASLLVPFFIYCLFLLTKKVTLLKKSL